MMLRNSAAIVVVLAATTLWGQSAGPSAARTKPVVAANTAEAVSAAARAKSAASQHLQEMGATLTRMHVLLKQMHTSAAKDSTAKANLEMWSLMVGELDKQYEQLSLAAREREEFEARRAALYKQADDKAAEYAKKAQAAKAQEAAKAAAANPNSGAQTPAAAQTTASPAASSTSPN